LLTRREKGAIVSAVKEIVMVALNITVDTQNFTKDDFAVLIQGGLLLHVSGVVNYRWEEWSAIKASKQFGLRNVMWDQVRDDTPGSLTCLIAYFFNKATEIHIRLAMMNGVDHYDIDTLICFSSSGHGDN
jgi:hypothetical protein